MKRDKIIEEIFKMNREDVDDILDVVLRRRQQLSEIGVLKFKIGDKVTWEHKNREMSGTVFKLNRKTLGVKRDDGVNWRIHPSFLRRN